jgi:ribosomal protein L37AE/L43A
MSSEKDRLRETLEERRRAEEDRFFEQQNRAAIEKLRKAKEAGTAPAKPTMRCPKDGEALVARQAAGVGIDFCPKCEGMWLEKGELEQIAHRERDSWLGRLFFGAPKL